MGPNGEQCLACYFWDPDTSHTSWDEDRFGLCRHTSGDARLKLWTEWCGQMESTTQMRKVPDDG